MKNIVQDITAEILRDNLSNLKTSPKVYENLLNHYGKNFFAGIKKGSNKATFGLQLGLTKQFLNFSFKNILDSDIVHEDAVLKQFFDRSFNAALKTTVEGINCDALVYILYRDLKKSITSSVN